MSLSCDAGAGADVLAYPLRGHGSTQIGGIAHESRTIPTLQGSCLLTDAVFAGVALKSASGIIGLIGSREEGKWALPHGEFGDVSDCPGWFLTLYLSSERA